MPKALRFNSIVQEIDDLAHGHGRIFNKALAKKYDEFIKSLPVDTDPKILQHLHRLRDDLLARQAGGIRRSLFKDRVTLEAYRKMLS